MMLQREQARAMQNHLPRAPHGTRVDPVQGVGGIWTRTFSNLLPRLHLASRPLGMVQLEKVVETVRSYMQA